MMKFATLLLTMVYLVLAPESWAQTWVDVTPASGPSPTPRTLAAAIYDPTAHAMVIFGGQDAGGRVNEVWALDLSNHNWTDLTPTSGGAPAPRITPSTVYDAVNHQLLTFSGQGNGGTFFNDTWAFDLTSNTWSAFSPPDPIPTIRYGVASCWDAVAQTQVIFAGFTFQGRFDDTWRFDPSADAWTDVTPASASPLERCLHAACYDELGRAMIIYGGQNGGPLGDVWRFDLAGETWANITPASGPDPRWFSTFEYDRVNRRATMFSGNRNTLGKANDVWVFDLTLDEWTELTPAGTAPAPRDGAASVHVPGEDRLVVFGGASTSGFLADVWSLEDLSDTPTGSMDDRFVADMTVLRQNRPNPFNPTTAIEYELSSAADVSLTIFDIGGRRVRRLDTGPKSAGPHTIRWDGRNDAGEPVSSGVYVYKLVAGEFVATRKMVLIR